MPHTHKGRRIPYPFNTNKETMQLWVLDRQVIFAMQGQPSFIDWKGKPPARCLDLGCGLGDWPVDSARLWPNSTYCTTYKWVHGNFLEKLPFNDNEFDYVHISAMAFCVPEDKWHSVYDVSSTHFPINPLPDAPTISQEICRVLKPNGYVEQGEEDPVFPVLPRWFTTPLHVGTSDEGREAKERDDELPHAHTLLEKLFYAVFESRFINTTPSSMLPGYFSASFKHVISPPIVKIPMPPLAPLPPFDLENSLSQLHQ
ncbi:hypothetical protein BC629DRAFT_118131 [Irpex lacteus]|nr:hypothetical protein BC629DRAFT_118131 [Irpex lacteus]